jgi:hypothetical protein
VLRLGPQGVGPQPHTGRAKGGRTNATSPLLSSFHRTGEELRMCQVRHHTSCLRPHLGGENTLQPSGKARQR